MGPVPAPKSFSTFITGERAHHGHGAKTQRSQSRPRNAVFSIARNRPGGAETPLPGGRSRWLLAGPAVIDWMMELLVRT